MTEQTKFNLLKFVYGELYLNSLNKTVATYTVPTWKAYKWRNILQWLLSHKHISALKIEYVSASQRRISYIFNERNLIYPQYLYYLREIAG